jgi:hypothetical protein
MNLWTCFQRTGEKSVLCLESEGRREERTCALLSLTCTSVSAHSYYVIIVHLNDYLWPGYPLEPCGTKLPGNPYPRYLHFHPAPSFLQLIPGVLERARIVTNRSPQQYQLAVSVILMSWDQGLSWGHRGDLTKAQEGLMPAYMLF